MITVILPTHRPHAIARTWRCFLRQRYEPRRLVVIENGPAVGACARLGVAPAATLHAPHNKPAAVNAGLAWLREHGGGAWVQWDDDDYYGPGYLTEMAEALRGADLVGKSSLFVRRGDGRLWLFERRGHPLGHSFGGHSDCLDLVDCGRWGDDERWLRDMLAAGAKPTWLGPRHFIWHRLRRSGHVWPADDDQIAHSLWRTGGTAIRDYGAAPITVADGALADSRPVVLPPFDFVRHVCGVPSWAAA